MAIQKIRSYGPVLIGVVGIALFAFIAQELVSALSGAKNGANEEVAELYGDNISYKEYHEAWEEFENYLKVTQNKNNFTDEETNSYQDQLLEMMKQQRMVEKEADELGLTVGDEELQKVIESGQSRILMSSIFADPQTGAFNVSELKNFLTRYEKANEQEKANLQTFMDYWKFIEKQVRNELLSNKYHSLIASGMLSNPISAKANHEARMNEYTAVVVGIPYTSVDDAKVNVSDAEIKAKFEEMKNNLNIVSNQESRSIKYITVPILASQADEDALNKELQKYTTAMNTQDSASMAVRESRSEIPYNGLYVSKNSLPNDVLAELDSMKVGDIKGPYTYGNTINVIKLLGKATQADSVQFRAVMIPGVDETALAQVDSAMLALNSGVALDSIAKRFNQAADTVTYTSAMIDKAQVTNDDKTLINTMMTCPIGTYEKITTTQGTIILNVLDRNNFIEKYNVAVIKRNIDFSTVTKNATTSKFNEFLAKNKTIADIEKNAAAAGYTVQEYANMLPSVHRIAGLSQTTDLLRWTFDKAKEGEVSSITPCGDNQGTLLVVMVKKINEEGEIDLEDSNLKNYLRAEVIKDKKAKMLIEQTKGKSLTQIAQMTGAEQDTLYNVKFAAPVFFQKLASSEPALSGAIAGSKQNVLHTGLRGRDAVYAYTVLESNKLAENDQNKYNEKEEMQAMARNAMQNMSYVFPALQKNAEFKDLRYKFFN